MFYFRNIFKIYPLFITVLGVCYEFMIKNLFDLAKPYGFSHGD